jgi:hypothetical protein
MLYETLLAQQLLGDEAPLVSSTLHTETSLLFTWRGRDDRLEVEITLDRRAHWRYRNYQRRDSWSVDHDADDGWPDEGKRRLMRFNRRAA